MLKLKARCSGAAVPRTRASLPRNPLLPPPHRYNHAIERDHGEQMRRFGYLPPLDIQKMVS